MVIYLTSLVCIDRLEVSHDKEEMGVSTFLTGSVNTLMTDKKYQNTELNIY